MNLPKRICCAALLLGLALLLSSCGGQESPAEDLSDNTETDMQQPNAAPEPPEEPVDEEAAAAITIEQYHTIINQAESYEYSEMEPTGAYRYALVQMQTQYNVPALFLEQETTFGIGYIRVFQYNPDSETVQEPMEVLMEGVGEAGGFRGSLFAAGDGNGVLVSSLSSGTGEGTTQRVTVEGDSLRTVTLWKGNFFAGTDWTAEEIGSKEIEWHDIADLSALENWTPDPDFVPSEPESETALPTDGDRIVFRGTINLYSYEETILLQGCPDPNGEYPGRAENFRLIVLDVPQKMTLISGDEQGHTEHEASLIIVPYEAVPEEYDGQHLIFSIDPNNTYWPSDTTMPVGQPWTNDVHILD